jgi:hypothetical protein
LPAATVADDAGRADSSNSAESPDYEPGTIPLRPVLVVAAILLLAAATYIGYSCTRSIGRGGGFSDQVSHYATGSVTYLAAGRSYLVRREDGSFVALSEVEADPADRVAGCLIRYRPDLSAAGQTGVFRDDCHGVLFSRDGIAIQGSAPPMEQHPVQVSGSQVSVRFNVCQAGGGSDAAESCRE